ncbi:hypothetical protein PGT21_016010 [Puccinia graminis f. sp. tritici]|uniref:Reverse transcriptase zinc-binding domain-containing protein n=1 Tax=Puccinia graminis f. sp. tritici TaxID=56615 RepID=A0A5B0NGE9_PUCGR|nr:hypothetical protein PGT21_016010 [Puccinia graminis f. sp. tritici]
MGNEFADRKAAEARNPAFLDTSIRGSLAAEKTALIQREQLWKRSPRVAFPTQSAIHQLCSGHVPLNAFQFKSKKVPYLICTTCGATKSVDHYLVSCSRFNKARTVARRILQDERITEISTRSLLHNPRAFKATKSFIQISARLPQFRQREDAKGSLQ